MYEADGAPAGVKEAAEDGGGGPAGVVEGLSARNEKPVPRPNLSGVDGAGLPGGLESGTMNREAMMRTSYTARALQASDLGRPTRRVEAASLFTIGCIFALFSHATIVLDDAMDDP